MKENVLCFNVKALVSTTLVELEKAESGLIAAVFDRTPDQQQWHCQVVSTNSIQEDSTGGRRFKIFELFNLDKGKGQGQSFCSKVYAKFTL